MLTVLLPENEYSPALHALLTPLLPPGSVILDPDESLDGLQSRRLLFAVALDEGGCNQSYYRMLSRLRRSETLLRGCVAGCVVTGVGEFYTKDVARDMVFAANQAGCAFLGSPLVEAPARCVTSAPRRWWAAWTSRPPSAPPSRSCWAA